MRKPNILGIEVRSIKDAADAAQIIHDEILLSFDGEFRLSPNWEIKLNRASFAASLLRRELKKLIVEVKKEISHLPPANYEYEKVKP